MERSPNLDEFGRKLLAYRERADLTLEALAHRTVPPLAVNTLRAWERGEARPQRKKLEKVGKALKLNVFQLDELLILAGYRDYRLHITNLPYSPSPLFASREDLLQTLHQRFMDGREKNRVQVLVGRAGVGKTQIALTYGQRYDAQYDVVWWVAAEERQVFQANYAALDQRRELGIPLREGVDARAGEVRRWFGQNHRWLLILDNARSPAAVEFSLPVGGSGHVLITSQNLSWGVQDTWVEVDVLRAEEAIDFLRQRACQDIGPAAGELAQELEYLPLALEQAAAYMQGAALTPEEYLARWRATGGMPPEGSDGPPGYSNTLARTLQLSKERVEAESPVAVQVLNLCAFLAPNRIPRDLLVRGMSDFSPTARGIARAQLKLDPAVACLRRCSLVHAEPGTLSIHRLVQAMTRDSLSVEGRLQWLGAAIQLLLGAYPTEGEGREDWATLVRLLPHILSVVRHIEGLEADDRKAVLTRWGYEMGLVLRDLGLPQKAKLWLEETLSILESNLDTNSPAVLAAANELGRVCQESGDLQDALRWYNRALAGYEQVKSPQDPMVGTVSTNLGNTFYGLGDYRQAQTYHERALGIAREAYGSKHRDVARALNNLGIALAAQGDFESATEAYREALEIDETLCGSDHPLTGKVAGNLGLALQSLGQMGEARAQFERALSIAEKCYGPDHPEAARAAHNLATVLQQSQTPADLKSARVYLERALATDERAYGPEHASVAADASALGSVLQDLHEWDLARDYLEQALHIDMERLGPDHPAVARDLLYLSECLLESEVPPDSRATSLAEARSYIERAIRIDEQKFGPLHATLGDDWNAKGRVVRAQGDLVEARACFERALQADRAAFGPDHPAVARDLYNLGDLARAEGYVGDARFHLDSALRIIEGSLGAKHLHAVAIRKELEEMNGTSTAPR